MGTEMGTNGRQRRPISPLVGEPLRDAAIAVDHEMSQALRLHWQLEHKSDQPRIYRHSMRTSFAVHFRSLLEFFHGAGPDGREHADGVRYCDFPGITAVDPFDPWERDERSRFTEAHKLMAHVSSKRPKLTATGAGEREWGCWADMRWLLPKIEHAMANVASAERHFRKTGLVLCVYPCECQT